MCFFPRRRPTGFYFRREASGAFDINDDGATSCRDFNYRYRSSAEGDSVDYQAVPLLPQFTASSPDSRDSTEPDPLNSPDDQSQLSDMESQSPLVPCLEREV
ncbi:hypothetical protein NMY22_g7028 [Coprinellus aureogranulatus]|nr:hypothetical protein NMY22_g7028 [Coprinellus aureogranulatus]